MLTQTEYFDANAIVRKIMASPTMRCNHTWIHLGHTHHRRAVWALYIPGKYGKKQVIMVTAGVHGLEKAGVIAAVNLATNLCILGNKHSYSLLLVPVVNPDGYSAKHPCKRKNGRCVDLNRDAFAASQLESQMLRFLFKAFSPKLYVDLHMTGNVMLLPRPWTKAYASSKIFAKTLRRLGLRWGILNGKPYGMWVSWFSEQQIPSVLIEIGRRSEPLVYKPLLAVRRVSIVIAVLLRLLRGPLLYISKPLRSGTMKQRLLKYEKLRKIPKQLRPRHPRKSIYLIPFWHRSYYLDNHVPRTT